jgi:hypothetical protein
MVAHQRFVWLAVKARCNEDAPWFVAWVAMLTLVAIVMWQLFTWPSVAP